MFNICILLTLVASGSALASFSLSVYWAIPYCALIALVFTFQYGKAKLLHDPDISDEQLSVVKKIVVTLFSIWLVITFALTCLGYYFIP